MVNSNLSKLDHGITSIINLNPNTYSDINVSFSKTFDKIPNVIVSFHSNSSGLDMGHLSLVVLDGTTTKGFSVRVYNSSVSGRSPAVEWIAISI